MKKKRKNVLAVGIVEGTINQDMVLVLNCGAPEATTGVCINVDPVGEGI